MSLNCLFFMLKIKKKGGDSLAESMATVPETVNVTNKQLKKFTQKKEKNYERIYYDNRNT